MMNLILFISMYPILAIMFFVLKNEGKKPEGGIIFGVMVKAEWIKDAKMQEITRGYEKQMKRNFIIFAILPLVSFLTPYMSIQFSIWTMWLLVFLIVLFVPYAKANIKVKQLKIEKGWNEKRMEETFVELKNAGAVRKVKWVPFLCPVLLGFLPPIGLKIFMWQSRYRIAAIEQLEVLAVSVWIFAVTGVILFGAAIWMDHEKTEVISKESDVNINYARAKKNIWKNFWLAAIWMNTLYTLILSLCVGMESFATVILAGAILESLLLLGMCIIAVKKIQRVDAKYEDKREAAFLSEEDDAWIWGMFYYNPKDRHAMVKKRVGIGTTMNMATPAGMGFTVFGTLALLALPVVCIWLILLEFTPINLSIQGDCLVGKHLNVDYEIPVEEIENLDIVAATPQWSKTTGTAMDNLDKGTFYIRNVGKCEVFLNPKNTAFLQFEADGKLYYMCGYTDAQTMEVYEQLTME